VTAARWAILLGCSCAAAHSSGDLRADAWLSELRTPATRSGTLRERSAPIQAGAKGDIREVYRKVAPATVLIRTPTGFGTGVVVDARGFVLTNHHVIAQAESVDFKQRVSVELGALGPQGFMEKRGAPLVAWVLKSDPLIDLAVLKLDGPPADLAAVQVSDSDPVPGEPVSALGHGGIGLLWAIRDGEVASVGRLATHLAQLVGAECQATADPALAAACATSRKSMEAERARVADQVPGLVIQTSCTLSPGDSGGPLVNRAGQLVGVNAFLQPDPTAPVAANFHVHVAEVRAFLKTVPAEPVAHPPDPVELMRGRRTQVEDGVTIAALPDGAVARIDDTFSVAVRSGRHLLWQGKRLIIETAAGRGVEWRLDSPPVRVADDVPLIVDDRYEAVLEPWGLMPKAPLEHMPRTSSAWKPYDADLDGHPDSAWTQTGEVQLDPAQSGQAPIVIVRRGKRAWWKQGELVLATEDADSGAVTAAWSKGHPANDKVGHLFAAVGLEGFSEAERNRAKKALKILAPVMASDDLFDVGGTPQTEDNGVTSQHGARGSAIVFPGMMAWVRRGESEWFLYDTMGKGTWDVVLFGEKKGVRPSLLKNEKARAVFRSLAQVYFNPEAFE
jgi:S1-C subfamily serine protease